MLDKVMLQKAVLIYNSPNGLVIEGYLVYISLRPVGSDALENSLFFRLMREIALSTCIFKHLFRDENLSLY